MVGYEPLYIRGYATGLVQERQEFILPDDAYPALENAFVWREKIKRKKGYELLGRLRRVIVGANLGVSTPVTWTFNLYATLIPPIIGQPNAQLQPGTIAIVLGVVFFSDPAGDGILVGNVAGNSGTVNYVTGNITLTHTQGVAAAAINFNYFPGLPVMGLRTRELNSINNEQLVAFDQVYAYIFNNGFQEFIPGTVWTGNDSDFFWSTNYWVTPPASNNKLFWVTNFSTGDPIRYTDGTAWIDFAPTINAAGDTLTRCLCILPFRSRLVVFNTVEGATNTAYFQRIRWAAIGNPISDVSALFPPGTVNPLAWRDDIRGQGGFLDIPTSESIVSVGFVRDNLVVYCERSTWQLRYTGRSIAPFQIEKVNSELGAESTFSAVQFDTSLVGIGDKGVVECDSFKSERIDIKIPDLVFQFNNNDNGTKRVHGIRDFQQRLAYWTYPFKPDEDDSDVAPTFPDRRLVYNYENDSWAIFTDSLTTLGTYQFQTSRKWSTSQFPWSQAFFTWLDRPALFPTIVGGNQQGFVEVLDSKVTNDVSLFITNITGNTNAPTVITSPNHNLQTGQVIKITDIPIGTPFASTLNNNIFGIVRIDSLNFQLWMYNPSTGLFDIPELDPPGVYIGGGQIAVRDGFSILSKKFNFLEDGQNIQMGYVDMLMIDTESGAITLNVFLDYNDDAPINEVPQNQIPGSIPPTPDTFFNTNVPTSSNGGLPGQKNWQRVYCPTRGAFLTIEWTLSNGQLVGIEQESVVQIDTQILWLRRAGKQLPAGF